jgi:hypothetical protein
LSTADSEILYNKLKLLPEKTYQKCHYKLPSSRKAFDITHGVLEHGADVLMFLDPDEDFLGRGQLTFIQVERGDVTTDQWHKKLCGQLRELFSRSHKRPNIHSHLYKRILLITSGVPSDGVLDAISCWNKSLPIPIELFDGRQFAKIVNLVYDSFSIEQLYTKPDK